jgi:hypothetical protein
MVSQLPGNPETRDAGRVRIGGMAPSARRDGGPANAAAAPAQPAPRAIERDIRSTVDSGRVRLGGMRAAF